jgi:hypothetical protein
VLGDARAYVEVAVVVAKVNNEPDGSLVVDRRPRACNASLAARLARLVADGSPGTEDALVAQVAGSIGWSLIDTTFGLSGLRGSTASGATGSGTGSGSMCGTTNARATFPVSKLKLLWSRPASMYNVSVGLNRSERHPAESHPTRWAFDVCPNTTRIVIAVNRRAKSGDIVRVRLAETTEQDL